MDYRDNPHPHLCSLFLFSQHCEAIEKAHVEVQRLRVERERYEESMKKAFMRGVCALNIEALGIFQNTEGRADRTPVFDQQGLSFFFTFFEGEYTDFCQLDHKS